MLVIGEKINATRKTVYSAIKERDKDFIADLATTQADAGADVIDVNATSGEAGISEKIEDMRWTVEVVKGVVDIPVAVDSDVVDVLAAGLDVMGDTPLWINSVTAEAARIEGVMPLAKKHDGPLVALCIDDDGIPKDVDGRMKAASRIIAEGDKLGIDRGRYYFDPLVMPLSTDSNAGVILLDSLDALKREFPGVHTAVGLSNVSFGLPARKIVNRAFLVLAMARGLDAAILDPTDFDIMMELRAADAVLGNDRFCRGYTKEFRRSKK